MSSSDEGGEGGETKGQMTQRHKRELKAVKAQMAKLGKKKKDEADKLEAELNARHAAELAALESGGSVGGGAAEAQAELTAAPTDKLSAMALDDDVEQESGGAGGRKMSKAQKRKEAKQKADAEREERIEREKAEMGDSDRVLEEQAMATKLAPLGLRMKEIKADGHCMYRSLEHQLQADAAASSRPSFLQLRAAAAEYMRAHPDTFSPFIEGCEDAEAFDKYCTKVESTAEWGGHLELQAMAHALQRCIHVHAVGMPDVEFGEEYGAGAATLHVAYCKHAYGLGEHYNSLQPLGGGSEADEEEVQGQEDD